MRHIKLKYLLFRFIYVRYATGLVNEGTKLLHLATSLFITTFTINLLFIWTVCGLITPEKIQVLGLWGCKVRLGSTSKAGASDFLLGV